MRCSVSHGIGFLDTAAIDTLMIAGMRTSLEGVTSGRELPSVKCDVHHREQCVEALRTRAKEGETTSARLSHRGK